MSEKFPIATLKKVTPVVLGEYNFTFRAMSLTKDIFGIFGLQEHDSRMF